MNSQVKNASAGAAEALGPLMGRTTGCRQTAQCIADHSEWREVARSDLIARSTGSLLSDDTAAKVAFRPDPYHSNHDGQPVAGTQGNQAAETRCRAAGPLTLPKRLNKLLKVGDLIASRPPTAKEMAFTHSVLCQVGLPRSKVNGCEFHRQSGDVWIKVQAGHLDEGCGPVLQPVPYGPMPRLALAMICTLAKRHNTREISIGASAAEFLRLIGMDDQNNRYKKLREQMHALAACRIQYGYRGRTSTGTPIALFDSWQGTQDKGQKTQWPNVLRLSQSYYDELSEHAVPLDHRALVALRGSAYALDVYTWLAQRLHRIDGRPILIRWGALRQQFATDCHSKDANNDFKSAFKPALAKALTVYPTAVVKVVKGGLVLHATPPPIPFNQKTPALGMNSIPLQRTRNRAAIEQAHNT